MSSVYLAVQPPDTAWHFRIGQCVSRKDEIFPALVMDRTETRDGLQIFNVRSFADREDRRDRRIIGGYLTDVIPGSEPCFACLLFNTGVCPSA